MKKAGVNPPLMYSVTLESTVQNAINIETMQNILINMKTTQGEWHYDVNRLSKHYLIEIENSDVSVGLLPFYNHIGDVHVKTPSKEEVIANAKLISQAPRLLESLKDILLIT